MGRSSACTIFFIQGPVWKYGSMPVFFYVLWLETCAVTLHCARETVKLAQIIYWTLSVHIQIIGDIYCHQIFRKKLTANDIGCDYWIVSDYICSDMYMFLLKICLFSIGFNIVNKCYTCAKTYLFVHDLIKFYPNLLAIIQTILWTRLQYHYM